MTASPRNIQTLASSDLPRDVETLRVIFCELLEVEESSTDSATLLLSSSGSNGDADTTSNDISVVLLVSMVEENPFPTMASLVVEEAVIARSINSPLTLRDTVSDHTIALVQLSMATIVALPPRLLDSLAGRRSLGVKLYHLGKENRVGHRSRPTLTVQTLQEGLTTPQKLPDKFTLPRKIPTLVTKIMTQNNQYETFYLNSTEAQEFETDLFKGKILILIKPPKPEDDPYWTEKLFSKKQRRIVVQCQGKFKKKPQGQVYLGGETYQLKLGLLTRGITGILLRFIESFTSTVVYSYGDKKEKGEDVPRIVVPAHVGFDRIHITPEGQEPPPVTHEPFFESQEDREKRKKIKEWDWNTSSTYSFTFYTMYFNFAEWKLASLPVASGMDLSSFWGDSPLRIVVYENESNKKKQHLMKDNRYHFVFQMKYKGQPDTLEDGSIAFKRSTSQVIAQPPDTPLRADEDEGEEAFRRRSQAMELVTSQLQEEPISDDDDYEFHDAAENEEDGNLDSISLSSLSVAPASEINLKAINNKIPAWIEMASPGRGSYTKYFAINVSSTENDGTKTILRSKSDCDTLLDQSGLRTRATAFVSRSFSPLLSSTEKRRRMLAYVLYKEEMRAPKSTMDTFVKAENLFLRRPRPDAQSGTSNVLLSGYIARAVSDRDWVEEWATLDSSGILNFRRTDKKTRSFGIRASSILSVNALYDESCPVFFGYSFLSIESIGRTVYLMFRDSVQRDAWYSALFEMTELRAPGNDFQLYSVDMPAQEYTHNSSVWDCKKRRVYNRAMFAFHVEGEQGRLFGDPLALVATTLQLAVDCINDDESVVKRHQFLKSASLLKLVDLDPLSENERVVFFLNLYHTMLMHGFLILGPPSTSLNFMVLFKEVAYEVGDELVSLAELEHCIIRAEMAHPAIFLSWFVIPKTSYRRLALRTHDFRINFALNSGSISSPSQVILYTPENLEEQLDAATRLGMKSIWVSKLPGARDVVVTLPRVCQWFAQDYGKPVDMITKLAPYLKPDDLEKLRNTAWSPTKNAYDMSFITIKYEDFLFECRPLSLTER